jgi:hypothetical protein
MTEMVVRVATKIYDGGSNDTNISIHSSEGDFDAFSYYSSQDYRTNFRKYGRDDQVIRQPNTKTVVGKLPPRRRRATTAGETRNNKNSTSSRQTRVSLEVYPSLNVE